MKRRTIWLGGGVAVVLVAAVGVAVAQGWFGCRPPADQRSALRAYRDDPVMASAPQGARLIEEISGTAACDSRAPASREETGGPEFAQVSRVYAVVRSFSASGLTEMFLSAARNAGWRLERTDFTEDSPGLWFCRQDDGLVAVLSIRSTVQPQTRDDPRLALTIRGVPSRASC